jgi:hypothetical protein
MTLTLYKAASFVGGSGSWAGLGICSLCTARRAKWMGRRGATHLAYCQTCADRLGHKTAGGDEDEE